MVTAFWGITLEILNPGQEYTSDIPVTDMMCRTKCHAEQSATSHVSVVGATS